MQVKAWNNGGDGYGICVGRSNRDRYFSRSWRSIEVEIDGQLNTFPLTGSFWRNCPEFRGRAIKEWFQKKRLAPWLHGNPPKFELAPVRENRFRLLRS